MALYFNYQILTRKTMKFQIIIDRDEDGVWIAECPAIPGCVSQGHSERRVYKRSVIHQPH
jgi:hypothetical protein